MKNKKILFFLGLAVFSLALSGCNRNSAPSDSGSDPSDSSSTDPGTSDDPVVKCTVIFDSQGGSPVESQEVDIGGRLTKPTDPIKSGFDFNGWYTEQALTNLYDFTSPVTTNFTLYAGWLHNVVKYTITFKDENGETLDSRLWEEGELPSYAYEKADTDEWDYTVDGWSLTQGGEVITIPAASADATYFAVVSAVKKQYTITFESNGGSQVPSITADYGSIITAPSAPTRQYYSFNGWYTEQALTNLYDFSAPLTQNWTLYANWSEPARQNVTLKTAVFADIQLCARENGDGYVGNAGNTVHAYISLKNHFKLCKEQDVDVIFMNGDIVNNAIPAYYELYEEAFTSVYGNDESQYPEVIWNMGNHEWWDITEHETADAVSLFNQYAKIGNVERRTTVTYYLDSQTVLPTYYKVIEGIPFLVVSGENSSGYIGTTMESEIASWLIEMSSLPSVQAGGPIYVAYHYALSTTLTHGNGHFAPCATLENLLKNYPQAVVFTGDTHYSGVNERAINQVDFTTINIGSSSYSRMDKMSATMTDGKHFYNMKIKGGKTSDELLGDANYMHEYTPTIHIMNTYDNLDTTIDRYFSTDDEEHPTHINQAWTLPRGTNKSNFTYTNDRFENTEAANELYGADGVSWNSTAAVRFGVKDGKMTVRFPDTIEYHYTEHFKIDVTGNSTKTYDVVGHYYKYNLEPQNMYFFLEDLPAGDNYTVKVTAYDYFDNPSLNYLESSYNDISVCADEVDNAFTNTYVELSSHLNFDEHATGSNSSIEYYYNGVKKNEWGSPMGQLIRDAVPGKTSGGENISNYLSIRDTENHEVILKAKIKNLTNSALKFGYTLYSANFTYENAQIITTGKEVAANSGWVSLEWNITKQFSNIDSRESITFLALIVSANGTGYNADGYEMHFLLDDMDVVAGDLIPEPDEHTGAKEFTSESKYLDGSPYYYFESPADSKVLELTDTIAFDVKFTSETGTLSFYLNEYYYGRYCGPFTLTPGGVLTGAGASLSALENDWYRITINLAETAKGGNPAFVSSVYLVNTTANGLIKYMGKVEPDIHIGAKEFTSSATWSDGNSYYFESPADSKVLDLEIDTIAFDVKFTSETGSLSFYLNEYYYPRYCGPFTLTTDGVLSGAGATLTSLEDGWYRITINLAQTIKTGDPAFVSWFNLAGSTTASGLVKYMGVVNS